MAKYAELEIITDLPSKKEMDEFIREFQNDIIKKGFDDVIEETLEELKTDLLFIVNEKIRVAPASGVNQGQAAGLNDLGQPTVNPPKSDEEILKYLTNGKTDIAKYNKSKDYSTLSESGIVFGNFSRGQKQANRVALRMEIDDGETVQGQYSKAKQFFSESIFALPDSSGKIRYYANPGLDISQFVKIKCSTQTGDGDAQPATGMSPAQRFQRDRHRKGYADWTLKQDGMDFIRNKFVDLTEPMNFIKEGDYSRARTLLNRLDKKNNLPGIRAQAVNLDVKDTQAPSMQSYTNSVDLIRNMQVTKKSDDISTTYELVSNYDMTNATGDFTEDLTRNIRSWVVRNEGVWFNKLVNKVIKLIKKFESNK